MNAAAQQALAAAEQGHRLSEKQIHAALVTNSLDDRIKTAVTLAVECLRLRHFDQALPLLELGWRLGAREEGILDAMVALLCDGGRGRDALDRIREGALSYAEQRDFAALLNCLISSDEVSRLCHVQPQDPLITEAVCRTFGGIALPARPLSSSGPLRVGYVLWGDASKVCRLPRVLLRLAEQHDKSQFSACFFSELGEHAFTSPKSIKLRRDCAALGLPHHPNPLDMPRGSSLLTRVMGLCTAIANEKIDIVVFQSQAPIFLAAALRRPAPIVIGFDHGSPGTYSSVALDACITSVNRFVIEHLCNSLSIDPAENCFLPEQEAQQTPLQRSVLELDDDALVVMTAGLPSKFAPSVAGVGAFFSMMTELLVSNPRLHWVLVGVTYDDVRHAWADFPAQLHRRVRFLGITDGIEHILPVADIYLDTFPISGGLCVYQAMTLGLPVVTYRFWWNQLFDAERQYSMVGDFLTDSEVVVAEPTFACIKDRLARLVSDEAYRKHLGAIGASEIAAQSNVPRFARACERKYLEMVDAAGGRGAA